MAWLRRLLNTLRRDRLDRDLEREIAFHLAERADDLRDDGLSDAEATRRARLRFGNPIVQIERTRDVDIATTLDAIARNLRHALRACVRTPGFSAAVIVTLGVGIGANSAMFSTIDAVLLRPLPLPDADRLVRVRQLLDAETPIAPGRLRDWAEHSTTLTGLTGYYVEDVSDTTRAFPERARRAIVAPRFLDVWGRAPALGRDFTAQELTTGGPRAVLVSWRYWQTRLDADPQVLQRIVRLEGEAFTVIGVMPELFLFPDRSVDFWWTYPVDGVALAQTVANRNQQWYTGIARLAPGVTIEQALAELTTIQHTLGQQYPETDAGIGVRITSYKQTIVGDVGQSLWMLYGAVSLLLLIAATNIAALLLARSTQRRDEVALRFALGASRRAVVGQLFTETAILSVLGVGVGVFVALAATTVIRIWAPGLPRREEIGIDARGLAYAGASAIVVAFLCGLLPALRCTRTASAPAANARAQVAGRHVAQWTLVGAQVALSMTLLAGAGLLFRGILALGDVDPGFDTAHVLALRVSGSFAETADRSALLQRIDTTLDALRALPGVDTAATAWSLPGIPRRYETEFELVEGRAASDARLMAEWRTVSPTYFAALTIPISSGTPCGRPPVGWSVADIVVNEAFANRYFPGRAIIGAHLRWEAASQTARIVGIAGNARERGLEHAPTPTVYACDSAPTPFPWFLLKTRSEPATVATAVRTTLREIDPLRSVYDMAPLADRIDTAYAYARARTSLVAALAATALLLACLGIYGTLSYLVGLRRREVSLRLALGASRHVVVRHIVSQTLAVIGAACLGGLLLSALLHSVLSGMLFGVSPWDPVTLLVVTTLVLGLGGAAAAAPAVRATRVDPMQVLRDQR